MGSQPRTRKTGGSWSDSRIDSSKPFNLKFYPNETRIDQWRESSTTSQKSHYYNPELGLVIPKNSFSVEVMCYEPSRGSRGWLGCYYPAVDGSRYGKDSQKRYGTPTLIYTLKNDKGENVFYTNTTYRKAGILPETFYAFNPQSMGLIHHESELNDLIDINKLGNDGKVYGKAFVALFPALPDVPKVHPSYYETHSAESAQRKFFTEYNEAKYLSQLDGRLASNIVNFQIQVRMPTPTITVKKKRMKVIM